MAMKWLYSKEIHTYECDACNATFSTDVQIIVIDAYCPFCGDTGRESLDISLDDISPSDMPNWQVKSSTTEKKKTERQLHTEDIMTERNCIDGGWWHPIQKRCVGDGNGFEFSEKDLTK